MKLKVQAQHLQPGDIVGSGETIVSLIKNSTKLRTSKVTVKLVKYPNSDYEYFRYIEWGKYTIIYVERPEKVNN